MWYRREKNKLTLYSTSSETPFKIIILFFKETFDMGYFLKFLLFISNAIPDDFLKFLLTFWLHWVFVAVYGLSLVSENRGCSSWSLGISS